jgi:hypothetical protein
MDSAWSVNNILSIGTDRYNHRRGRTGRVHLPPIRSCDQHLSCRSSATDDSAERLTSFDMPSLR